MFRIEDRKLHLYYGTAKVPFGNIHEIMPSSSRYYVLLYLPLHLLHILSVFHLPYIILILILEHSSSFSIKFPFHSTYRNDGASIDTMFVQYGLKNRMINKYPSLLFLIILLTVPFLSIPRVQMVFLNFQYSFFLLLHGFYIKHG